MIGLMTKPARTHIMDLRHDAARRDSGSRLFAGRSRKKLFQELHRIHRAGPFEGRRLRPDGEVIGYRGKNAGGYTLESLLGIRPNGRPDPDFEGWEIKAHSVRNLMKSGNALLTLFSSQPAGGFYNENGPEAFVRKFGYAADRYSGKLNIYADHFAGQRNPKTGLTLHIREGHRGPYDWCDPPGALVLSDDDGLPAAIWPLAKLASALVV